MRQSQAHIIPDIAASCTRGPWRAPAEACCWALCDVKAVRFRDDDGDFIRRIARHRMELGDPDEWRNCLPILASEASAGSGAGCRPCG